MTKYVLNSGGLKREPEKAKRYFAELLKGLGACPTMLMSFFAEPKETWSESFQIYQDLFGPFMPKEVSVQYILAELDSFNQQVDSCDVIYCHGGSTNLALERYKAAGAVNAWRGKVVGANSATTAMLSKFYWSPDERTCGEGLGVIPIKTLIHYRSAVYDQNSNSPIDWQKAKEDLKNYGDKTLPIYALEEGQFEVFKV